MPGSVAAPAQPPSRCTMQQQTQMTPTHSSALYTLCVGAGGRKLAEVVGARQPRSQQVRVQQRYGVTRQDQLPMLENIIDIGTNGRQHISVGNVADAQRKVFVGLRASDDLKAVHVCRMSTTVSEASEVLGVQRQAGPCAEACK